MPSLPTFPAIYPILTDDIRGWADSRPPSYGCTGCHRLIARLASLLVWWMDDCRGCEAAPESPPPHDRAAPLFPKSLTPRDRKQIKPTRSLGEASHLQNAWIFPGSSARKGNSFGSLTSWIARMIMLRTDRLRHWISTFVRMRMEVRLGMISGRRSSTGSLFLLEDQSWVRSTGHVWYRGMFAVNY